jgi:hypothetical protein
MEEAMVHLKSLGPAVHLWIGLNTPKARLCDLSERGVQRMPGPEDVVMAVREAMNQWTTPKKR